MLNSWFSSKSSRHRSPPPVRANAQSGLSDASSVSQSTVEPVQTPGNLTSASDVPLEEVHAHINDPSTYAPTPSLIHSAEKKPGTLRTSDAPASSLDAATYQPERDTAQIAQRVSPPQRPEGTLFTPQDAIIAQVFGKSAPPATCPADASPPSPSNAPRPSVSLMTSDSVPTAPPSIPTSRAQSGPTLTIYDPFSGAKLGLGEHTPKSSSTVTPREHAPSAPLPSTDDRKLWSSLERILELQAEIAAMHADMEGVGGRGPVGNVNTHTGAIAGEGGNVGPRKRSKRGQTLPVGDEEPEEHEPESDVTGVAASEISTDHSDGDDDDDDDDDDDGIHGKKRRDEEFTKLAERFAQRKAAIGGIMNKLDALSTALKTFHTIPPPLFDLAMSPARTNTMSSAPSNVSAASSPPPLHVHTGRPSSSQAVHPITPPMVVPPISTLVPPASSGDPRAPPELTPIVTPVLPKMAFPTIIPGAPHAESPADILDHAESIFQRVP